MLRSIPSPLSRYCTLFPTKLNKSSYPKANALLPTAYTWMSHDGSPKPFLGHFVADIQHASEPRMYPIYFYVFEDATSLQILLSYVTLEKLGIVIFKVPNLAATSQVDNLNIPTSPNPSAMRKTTKTVTFQHPTVEDIPLHCPAPSPTSCHGMRKTTSPKVSQFFTYYKYSAQTPCYPIKAALVHHLSPKATGPTKSALKVQLPQVTSPYSRVQVQDIMPLKQAFPTPSLALATCLGCTPSGQTPTSFPYSTPDARYTQSTRNKSRICLKT